MKMSKMFRMLCVGFMLSFFLAACAGSETMARDDDMMKEKKTDQMEMKKDDTMMKEDTTMKADTMMKDDGMKGDSMDKDHSEPMTKTGGM